MNNMEQKRVSYKIAKALKAANYPQEDNSITYIYCDSELMSLKVFYSKGRDFEELLNAPTYLDVWLWLWREKRFPIDAECMEKLQRKVVYNIWENGILSERYDDPEEAIIAAINYLVDNNLIN